MARPSATLSGLPRSMRFVCDRKPSLSFSLSPYFCRLRHFFRFLQATPSKIDTSTDADGDMKTRMQTHRLSLEHREPGRAGKWLDGDTSCASGASCTLAARLRVVRVARLFKKPPTHTLPALPDAQPHRFVTNRTFTRTFTRNTCISHASLRRVWRVKGGCLALLASLKPLAFGGCAFPPVSLGPVCMFTKYIVPGRRLPVQGLSEGSLGYLDRLPA